MRSAFILLVAALAMTGICGRAATAVAQPQHLSNYRDWSAFVDGDGANRVCYIGSIPKTEEGKYTQRDPTFTRVAHWPSEKRFGEVSVEAGYTYKPGSDVEMIVDGATFKLFSDGSHAWARVGGDKALIDAMKRGSKMVVRGTSSRGTLTTDTYSLLGFSAAYEAINKACGVK